MAADRMKAIHSMHRRSTFWHSSVTFHLSLSRYYHSKTKNIALLSRGWRKREWRYLTRHSQQSS
eukprot:scaffold113543_cov51-Attheya_sp.AAC.4